MNSKMAWNGNLLQPDFIYEFNGHSTCDAIVKV